MKKAITVLLWILMSLIAFVFLTFPVYLAADLCDYEMDIINLPIYTALLAGFSVTVVIFTIIFRYKTENVTLKIMLALLLLPSMINACLCIELCRQLSVIVCSFVQVGCSCYLTIRYGWPRLWKLIVLIECALVLFPFYVIATGKDFTHTYLIDRLDSPGGAYYVQAECLEGDTTIWVYKNERTYFLIFGFTKIEEMVYFPDRSEVDDFDIHWENDTTIIIGTEEYRID